MRELNKWFGIAVRKRRLQLGLFQEALGFKTGHHRPYISEIERGLKSPTLQVVRSLAEGLEMRASALVQMAEEYEQKQAPLTDI